MRKLNICLKSKFMFLISLCFLSTAYSMEQPLKQVKETKRT